MIKFDKDLRARCQESQLELVKKVGIACGMNASEVLRRLVNRLQNPRDWKALLEN